MFAPLRNDSLQVRFESPEALLEEFEKNISNRGIFVATQDAYEIRQAVDVQVLLDYVSGSDVALSLAGEIVHCIPPEMASGGVVPGVAVQFEAGSRELRDAFEPLLEQQPIADPDEDCEGARRRSARRGPVRVPVRVMPTMSPPFEATSRDLSATGILLSIKEHALPVDEIVRVCLWHPSGQPSVELDGKVVREVENQSGRVAAAAIAFDRNQAAEPRARDVIDALREAGHRSRLGGISGSLSDLGLANMLQMFGCSAPCGTLVVEFDGEQGWVAFVDGQLVGAELGLMSGQEALVAMLDSGDGQFEFEANVDPKLVESAEPRPLAGAVLEAVCALDEMQGDAREAADEDAQSGSDLDVSDDDATLVDFGLDVSEAEMTVVDFGLDVPEVETNAADFGGNLAEADVTIIDFGLGEADDDVTAIDLGPGSGEDSAALADHPAGAVVAIDDSTTFEVDVQQQGQSGDALEKTEAAVVELATSGMSVARLCAIIPEPDDRVQRVIEELVEAGVLRPR
ncbi:MAG: hypothetical protein CL908_06045 [Deltaproteobacteria bacterium]|nr:hypothetical protein [Deltaproteobacteria bacterium]